MAMDDKAAPESNGEMQEPSLLDVVDENKLLHRVDVRLVPVLIAFYLMAFLDRINIGNAITLGLPQELHLTGTEINVALTLFYVPYILFEIPSNLLLKRIKPHVWLSGLMFAFGLVMLCHGFVQNYSGLLAARFFLGVAEAGAFPGCLYLLSMWYKRDEALRRVSFFFNSMTLAGAFGGLLASAIGKLDGTRGYSGWRWIFILEGLLTIVLSCIAHFVLLDFPDDSKFLTQAEKVIIYGRLQSENDSEPPRALKVGLGNYFKDYKSYLGALMYLGGVIPGYGLSYFIPSILSQYHYSPISTQLHSVPPFAVAFVFSVTLSFTSAWANHRLGFIIFAVTIGIAGAGILLNVHDNVDVEYGAIFLVTMGTFGSIPIAVCWYISSLRGHFERSVGSAFMVSVGNVGGIIATFSFLSQDAPFYHAGFSILIFGLCLLGGATLVYAAALYFENRKAVVRDELRGGQRYLL